MFVRIAGFLNLRFGSRQQFSRPDLLQDGTIEHLDIAAATVDDAFDRC